MSTHAAKLVSSQRRPLGNTGLRVPPILFGCDALANARRTIADTTKLAIVGEWFQHVEPPVFIGAPVHGAIDRGFDVLCWALERLDAAPHEVMLHLAIHAAPGWRPGESHQTEPADSAGSRDTATPPSQAGVSEEWEVDVRRLGGRVVPTLVSLRGLDTYVAAAASADDCARRLAAASAAYRALVDLRTAGRVRGIGICGSDWRGIEQLAAAMAFDYVLLEDGLSVLHHPIELIQFVAHMAQRNIPIINTGVFAAGFLVGDTQAGPRLAGPDTAAERRRLAWRKAFVALCQGHSVSPAHASIQFGLSPPGVLAVALDSSQPDRVAENVRSALTEVPPALWASMKEEGLLAEDFPYLG